MRWQLPTRGAGEGEGLPLSHIFKVCVCGGEEGSGGGTMAEGAQPHKGRQPGGGGRYLVFLGFQVSLSPSFCPPAPPPRCTRCSSPSSLTLLWAVAPTLSASPR